MREFLSSGQVLGDEVVTFMYSIWMERRPIPMTTVGADLTIRGSISRRYSLVNSLMNLSLIFEIVSVIRSDRIWAVDDEWIEATHRFVNNRVTALLSDPLTRSLAIRPSLNRCARGKSVHGHLKIQPIPPPSRVG